MSIENQTRTTFKMHLSSVSALIWMTFTLVLAISSVQGSGSDGRKKKPGFRVHLQDLITSMRQDQARQGISPDFISRQSSHPIHYDHEYEMGQKKSWNNLPNHMGEFYFIPEKERFDYPGAIDLDLVASQHGSSMAVEGHPVSAPVYEACCAKKNIQCQDYTEPIQGDLVQYYSDATEEHVKNKGKTCCGRLYTSSQSQSETKQCLILGKARTVSMEFSLGGYPLYMLKSWRAMFYSV